MVDISNVEQYLRSYRPIARDLTELVTDVIEAYESSGDMRIAYELALSLRKKLGIKED